MATHRLHHQNSDQPGDPHSPRDGGFWAHVGWILFGETRQIATRIMSRYAPDLANDRFYIWLNDYHWLTVVAVSAILLPALYELDITWLEIRLLELLGVARNVKVARTDTRLADREAA